MLTIYINVLNISPAHSQGLGRHMLMYRYARNSYMLCISLQNFTAFEVWNKN